MVTWAQNVMTTVTAGRSGPGGAVEDSDKKLVMQQQRFDGTIGDFMKMLQEETGILSRHWHVYREQAGAYHRMEEKETMVPGVLYIVMDFSMNYAHDHLKELQSGFFAKG